MNDDATKSDPPGGDSAAAFSQTHWTSILLAQGSSASSQESLNRLCHKYWPPVYAFIRRKWTQHPHHKAEDLTQGFFAEFIRKFPDLELSATKGKFRTYLLACLTRFLCKDLERSPSSRELVIPPDELELAAAANLDSYPADCTPERTYDIVWANTLVRKALDALRDEYAGAGKGELHSALVPLLTGRSTDGAYATMAAGLRLTEGALRVAAHHLRRRFGEILRTEVAHTVPHNEDTDEELRYLLSLWGADRSNGQTNS